MNRYTVAGMFLLNALLNFNSVFSQNFVTDTAKEIPGLGTAINVYHQYLSPETGLYDGSEYTYDTYYPFTINEGHPFFQSKYFDTGVVFYNDVLYEKVPLLYDIIHGELLTKDPSKINVIRLNEGNVRWFTIYGQPFKRLVKDSLSGSALNTGFYAGLYEGATSLYMHASKIFKENTSSASGINKYTVEVNEYFIRKGNTYFKITSRKSLLNVLDDRKKEIGQFMNKNKLKLKKNKRYALTKIVAYYNEITNGKKEN